MSTTNVLYVALGAALGGVTRYLASLVITPPQGSFPWATFAVNVVGSLIIGLIMHFSAERATLSDLSRLFLAVGFCGGLTTFSTFSAETIQLFQLRKDLLAFIYISASLFASIAATYVGIVIGRTL